MGAGVESDRWREGVMATFEDMVSWAIENPNPTGRTDCATIDMVREHFGVAQSKAMSVRRVAAKDPAGGKPGKEGKEGMRFEDKGDTATLTTVSRRIRTLNDALSHGEVDTDHWEVDRYIVNSWEMGSREGVTPLWQVKVWLKRRTLSAEVLAEAVADLMREHAPDYSALPKLPKRGTERVMLELCVMDLHVGKLAWAAETGEDYDHVIALERLHYVTEDLLEKTSGVTPELIALPVGNDLLHVDNLEGMTTAGTRQDIDTRPALLFTESMRAVVRAVDRLMALAPVRVLVVPGNHDLQSTFHLGVALQAWYRNCQRVEVDNSPKLRKYLRYGRTLLGYAHGGRYSPKERSLPLVMAQEQPKAWAQTIWREWHIGHWHKKREERYTAGDTYNGVHVRVIPALTGTDAWHYQHGLVGEWKAAEAYLWDYRDTYMGHLSSMIEPQTL